MPKFIALNPGYQKPVSGILIDSEESMAKFIADIKKADQESDATENKQVIYIDPKMMDAAKSAATHFPQPYKDDFEKIHPEGVVGFVMALTDKQLQASAELQRTSPSVEVTTERDDLDKLLDDLDELNLTAPSPENELTQQRSVLFANKQRQDPTVSVEEPARKFNEVYDQLFSDLPYDNLAFLINKLNDEVQELPGHGKTHYFKQQLDNILPIMAFAVEGARQEWAKSDNLEEKAKVQLKMETFEAVERMLKSLRALANNKSRYTEAHYQKQLEGISKLLEKQQVEPMMQGALFKALDSVIKPHVLIEKPNMYYQRKKGSTAFDATGPSLEIKGHQKRLKIEHNTSPENSAVTVTGRFSYSRKSVIDVQTGKLSGVKKIFAQRKNQLAELNAQVSDFVTVALNEYQKGTRENPIYLQPSKGNQAELSLAILMEFKKQAILEGKELIAADDSGKRIKITPSAEFSETEKAYFEHFAIQVPKVDVGKWRNPIPATQSAAYQLFKDVKMENGKTLKGMANNDLTFSNLSEAMTQHLKTSVAAQQKQQEKNTAAVLKTVTPILEASIKEAQKSSSMHL